jgi:hypothetical protein
MNKHKIPAELRQKWLDKSNSNDFNEMPRETIQKLIDYLISKQTKE